MMVLTCFVWAFAGIFHDVIEMLVADWLVASQDWRQANQIHTVV